MTPDPQAVRRIARRSLQNDIHRLMPGWFTQGVGPVIRAEAGPGMPREDFEVWFNAVCDQIRTAQITASWPDEQPQTAAARSYPDSHSPWSQWLTDQLLDHEWTSSGLVEASGHVFDLKQVSRWLHSQDVPEPWAAVLVAKAFGASVAEALRAAEHGVVVDAVLAEREPLHDEFGLRIDYVSTLREERPAGNNLADAQTERDRIAARPDVVSCTVIGWLADEWHEIGDDRG